MEAYGIEFLYTARKELASLPQVDQKRIAYKIKALQTNPCPPGVKTLKNKVAGVEKKSDLHPTGKRFTIKL